MSMRESPAAQRNRAPIADVLADELPHGGRVLEIASGTGEHVVHFAGRFPNFDWHPTDPQQEALASIAAYREASGLDNVRPPVALDAASKEWPIDAADAIMVARGDLGVELDFAQVPAIQKHLLSLQ